MGQLLETTEGLMEESKATVKETKEAVAEIRTTVETTESTVADVKDTATKVGETVEVWRPLEQKLTQMVERGLVLVSTTMINSVAERFRKSARRQSRKIFYLWSALFGVAGAATWTSWELLKLWQNAGTMEVFTPDLILRLPLFGGLTALIVFLYRALKPAEQERKDYEKQSNVLASSMAVHKESLSAPLQRVIAEELAWKSAPSSLGVYLQNDSNVYNVYVENLLSDDISVGGYEVICWDKKGCRTAESYHQFPTQAVLHGHEPVSVIENLNFDSVGRIELRDRERNVIGKWVNNAT